MAKKENKYWWVWLAVVGAIIFIWWGYNWYHTRISMFTPQSGSYSCPGGKPIKGNSQSGIYHVPGGQYYDKTMAERCFNSETAAQNAGYRRSSR